MAVMKRPVPKDNPAPLSAISYGDSVTVGELVYSLDKFRPRFPLRWQAILILTNSFSFLVRREVVNLHFLKNSLTSI